jgi:hypothetical protein
MRRNRLITSILSCGFVLAFYPLAQAGGASVWRTYHNDRFGTTIDYPDFFKPMPPPENGDGLEFQSADGAEFLAFGSYNVDKLNLAGLAADVVKNLERGKGITYQTQGSDWFVISGTQGKDIFYERHLISHRGEILDTFVITYPMRLKAKYDSIVSRMSISLRAGKALDTSGMRALAPSCG